MLHAEKTGVLGDVLHGGQLIHRHLTPYFIYATKHAATGGKN
jgi:hypothetical protein